MKDWAGFLAFAERLSTSEGEAELRSAVSRAYYSAYNDARRYVRIKDPSYLPATRKDPDHWKVWDWFSQAPGKARQVATLGQALRTKRTEADYDVYNQSANLANLKYEATTAVQKAGKILQLLASFRTD